MYSAQTSDTDSSIPPELEMLSRVIDGQSPAVRELFQYALIMLMVEKGNAEVIEQHVIDARAYLTFKTSAGETFTVVKPDASPELLERMRGMARQVLREDSADEAGESV